METCPPNTWRGRCRGLAPGGGGGRRKEAVAKEGLWVFWRLTCGVITARPGKLASGDYICLTLLADIWTVEIGNTKIVMEMKVSGDTDGMERVHSRLVSLLAPLEQLGKSSPHDTCLLPTPTCLSVAVMIIAMIAKL